MTRLTNSRFRVRSVGAPLEEAADTDAFDAAAAKLDPFEGDDSILSTEELRSFDGLDSELAGLGGDGVRGTDQYGIHTTGTSSSDTSLGVVCGYPPQINEGSVLRGGDELDDETEERVNAARWKFSERITTLIEATLDDFLRQTQP